MQVLIVEDSPDFLALLRRYLSQELAGVQVTDYVPSEQGGRVPEVADRGIDVILLDYQLGTHQDGLTWLKALRAQPGCPPVIFMTAYGDEYVAVEAMKLGAADYVNKRDLNSGRLLDLIRDALVERDELDWALDDAAAIAPPPAARDGGTAAEPEDGYRFLRPIGAGAMSKVYLAERLRDGLTLALKLISLKNLQTVEVRNRFLREAELASSLESPYVVRIHDFGFTPTYGYMAMELFTRGDLQQRMKHGVSREDALLYLWNIAQGLTVIHRVGIVHRDLKPGNVMFRSDDSMAIADFGISKRLVEPTLMTTMGKVLGTPHYMSPEQGQGLDIDARSDLYALGIMMFELLAGHPPFDAADPLAVIHQHVTAPVPPMPKDSEDLQPVVNRLLAKDPRDRYADAEALADALRPYLI